MKNEFTPAQIVDRLGHLKAELAELENLEKSLKADLILTGQPEISGELFRATVSHCVGRELINWRALAEHLGATEALIHEFTETGMPYSVVRVGARKGAK
jgi:hypothetical protein